MELSDEDQKKLAQIRKRAAGNEPDSDPWKSSEKESWNDPEKDPHDDPGSVDNAEYRTLGISSALIALRVQFYFSVALTITYPVLWFMMQMSSSKDLTTINIITIGYIVIAVVCVIAGEVIVRVRNKSEIPSLKIILFCCSTLLLPSAFYGAAIPLVFAISSLVISRAENIQGHFIYKGNRTQRALYLIAGFLVFGITYIVFGYLYWPYVEKAFI